MKEGYEGPQWNFVGCHGPIDHFRFRGVVVLFSIWLGLLGNLGVVAAARRPQPALAKAVEMWPLQRTGPALHPRCSLRAVRVGAPH